MIETGKSKSYRKNIVCLEAFWYPDVEDRLTVQPILELASRKNHIRKVHLTCNTLPELAFNLRVAPHKKGYSFLYFGFHGFPGGIYLPGLRVEIEEISEFMGKRFSNWIVHFSSCTTLNVEKGRIMDFMKKTNPLMVIGYKQQVSWIESAVLDLLLLDFIQQYKDMRKFWNRFRRTYKTLIRETGMDAFHRET